MRWNRSYRLVVGIRGKAVIVEPPIRISFDCTKGVDVGINKLNIKIWNLKESNRNALIKDEEENLYIPVSLEIGYQNKNALLFKGNVLKGSYDRQGADIINSLECLDGGYDVLNSFTAKVANDNKSAMELALGDMKNTAKGAIGSLKELIRPRVIVGNSSKLIEDLAGEADYFIDNEQLFLLNKNEVREKLSPIISAETGLIKINKSKGKAEFVTMLNPLIKLGGLVKIESINKTYNGVYKVFAIGYQGDNYSNDWLQTVTAVYQPEYKVAK